MHIYNSGVSFHICPLPCYILQMPSECLALVKGDQQLPTVPPSTQVFSSVMLLLLCCTLSTLRSTLYQFHVAILSPCLSWFLSFSWADPVSSFSQGWSLVQFYVLRSKVVIVSMLPPLISPSFSFSLFFSCIILRA